MTTAQAPDQPKAKPLASDEILRIARQDAEQVYRDVTRFRISLFLEPDGWHVEYRLFKPFVAGGGPVYVIDAVTGEILSKTYYQ